MTDLRGPDATTCYATRRFLSWRTSGSRRGRGSSGRDCPNCLWYKGCTIILRFSEIGVTWGNQTCLLESTLFSSVIFPPENLHIPPFSSRIFQPAMFDDIAGYLQIIQFKMDYGLHTPWVHLNHNYPQCTSETTIIHYKWLKKVILWIPSIVRV